MALSLYERETLLLGQVLLFGEDALKWIYPQLTGDKLIFSKTGVLGGKDHTHIFVAIEMCHAKKKNPNIVNVMEEIADKSDDMRPYLISLEERVKGYYRIHTLDVQAFMELAEQIDKAGVVYQTLAFGQPYTKLMEDSKDFQSFVDSVEDADEWLNEYTTHYRSAVRNGPEGYESTYDISLRARQEIEQIKEGKTSLLLPIGFPNHRLNALYPYGSLTIVTGGSNYGKSAYTNAIILGTAIGLQKNNIPGCVSVNSLENSATSMVKKLASIMAGFNTQKLYAGPSALQGDDFKYYLECIDYVGQLPIFIDTTDMLKTTTMQYRLNSIHSSDRGPVRLLVSDYTELFGDDDGDNKEQRLNFITRKHLSVARTMNAAVMLISGVTYGDGNNKSRIAGAEGIRYAKGMRYHADFQVEIWNPIEMKKKGVDFVVPEGLDDDHLWLLFEKTRDVATPDPIPMNWTPEYTRVSDPNLDYGYANGGPLFEHFLDTAVKEEKKPVIETEYDWSSGLNGGAF